ncbi:hypothetical protein OHB12_00980 [Nocardia sp. NBC_01730]|uniref:DUF6882 domain-containing protein n=1 Tax=Nocardia sp. NBC_01730 TaxID=2975998 RepID=UPI002E120A13|nr:DUF6882 domain-containing protein [Nocardia sp. NBC_01730]WSG60143.1 hypothetical protein OHB12_00980 [Nocardia sp. NBC_01730]
MSESVPLTRLLDDAGLLSLEHRLHLEEVLGAHAWQADLDGRRLEFVGAERSIVCTKVHLLGTADAESWLWGWANPWGYPPALIKAAQTVREFGFRYGVAELCAAELPVHLAGAAPEPHQVAGLLADAAKVVCGRWSSYCGVTNGTCVAFLVEHPAFLLPPPTASGLARVLAYGIGALPLTDHRRAIHSYLTRRGLLTEFLDGYRWLEFSGHGVAGDIEFDASGHVAHFDIQVVMDRIELPSGTMTHSAHSDRAPVT